MRKEKIEQLLHQLGLDTYGFIPMREFKELVPFLKMRKEKKIENEFEENEIEKRINPFHYMEDGKTILSIAFPYYCDENKENNGFSIYTKGMDYHKVVRSYLDQICELIQSLGGKAEAFVDSNTLPERYIAYLAGVGFIGRNNMIITKNYGSYVFLGEIITDLEIECKELRTYSEIKEYIECQNCRQCYEACPTKSIHVGRINPNICLSYLTQKKNLTDQEITLLKDNVFGCDFCQLICPYNLSAKFSERKDFMPYDFMNCQIETYANMDNAFFKEKISKTSCGWRGKNIIRRNAIIQLGKQGKDVTQYKGESPYVNEYIDKVQKLYGKETKEDKND